MNTAYKKMMCEQLLLIGNTTVALYAHSTGHNAVAVLFGVLAAFDLMGAFVYGLRAQEESQ